MQFWTPWTFFESQHHWNSCTTICAFTCWPISKFCNTSYEMPNSVIITHLFKYFDVLHHHCGYFKHPGFEHIENGVHHHRVCLKQLIPNFMHFGRIQINLCYNNKTQTCRRCHCTEDFANACPQTYILQLQKKLLIWLQLVCKQRDHRAKSCPFY